MIFLINKIFYNKKSRIIFDKDINLERYNDFKKHEEKFNPVLTELKQKMEKKEAHDFFKDDWNTLFKPHSNRFQYVNQKKEELLDETSENIERFNNLLEKMDYNKNFNINYLENIIVKNHNEFMKMVKSSENINNLSEIIDYQNIVFKVSKIFEKLTFDEIDFMIEFIKNHEAISLISIEPHLIKVLPLNLFFRIVLPLHYTGAFSTLCNSMAELLKNEQNVKFFSKSFFYNINFISKYKFSTILGVTSLITLSTFTFIFNKQEESEQIIQFLYKGLEKFLEIVINNIRAYGGQVSFEVTKIFSEFYNAAKAGFSKPK